MDAGMYRIGTKGCWELKEIPEFYRAFTQVYAFTYCFDSDLPTRDANRINHALENYPWRGGYSMGNLCAALNSQVKHEQRPSFEEMQFHDGSGWIDVHLNFQLAMQIAASVAATVGSVAAASKSYAELQKALHDIRVQAGKSRPAPVQPSPSQIQNPHGLTQNLAHSISFQRRDELNQRTGSMVVTAKLLSAHYRSHKTLVDFTLEGKAFLPQEPRLEG